ncbi:hypothetical protein M427DRAFT_138962 [Gonapodya prolifera JEL478]|uniref:Uncharacterized protein n=1 Tax=Gonapodya prolifera (strain JEL478) TaxID=1344416 RepID=A0A139A2V4_GONPJ|nr:hypothetical protein M427DRAFT_138962 [Gonapodya prolifera JEL478]|eukprot:KXS10683.1 hypothetical protein M427DRAFT_138962 [Gonapodya prolifera JEL478]
MAYEDQERKLDAALRELTDALSGIISSAQIERGKGMTSLAQNRMALATEASNIVRSGESILSITDGLRQSLLLHDYRDIAAQMTRRRATILEASQDDEHMNTTIEKLQRVLKRIEEGNNG